MCDEEYGGDGPPARQKRLQQPSTAIRPTDRQKRPGRKENHQQRAVRRCYGKGPPGGEIRRGGREPCGGRRASRRSDSTRGRKPPARSRRLHDDVSGDNYLDTRRPHPHASWLTAHSGSRFGPSNGSWMETAPAWACVQIRPTIISRKGATRILISGSSAFGGRLPVRPEGSDRASELQVRERRRAP